MRRRGLEQVEISKEQRKFQHGTKANLVKIWLVEYVSSQTQQTSNLSEQDETDF